MTLGKIHTDHETVDVAGVLFDLRCLTRAEAARFNRMVEADDPKDRLEIAVIAAATDTPEAETAEWYAATPGWAVEDLIGHIQRISRLTGEAQKSGGTGDRPGGG